MANTVTGTTGADSLRGSDSADLLLGLQGDDTLAGLQGNDTLDGGDGFDQASYESAGYRVSADLASGRVTLLESVHTLVSIESLYGGKMGDALLGDGRANQLWGHGGNDLLDGRGGDDMLRGGDGSDTLVGGAGSDTLDGGPGLDVVSFEAETSALDVDLSTGAVSIGGRAEPDALLSIEGLLGGSGNDRLAGDAEANLLAGAAGDDALSGRDGNDTLVGGTGNDTLDGGAGIDWADYSASPDPVRATLDEGQGAGSASSGNERDVLRGIEALIGSAGADLLVGDAGVNSLMGGAGNDTLDGGAGADWLAGGDGADLLRGGAGNDTFSSLGDGDTLIGGDGFDTLLFANNDAEGSRRWMINLATGAIERDGVRLDASLQSIEAIYSGKGQSLLIGDDGDNLLKGGTVVGGGGNDTLEGFAIDYRAETTPISGLWRDGVGTLRLAGQVDTIRAAYWLLLGAGNDVVDAGDSLWVQGGAGDDRLTARELTGGLGNDTLEGSTAHYDGAAGAVIVSLQEGLSRGADGQDTLIGVQQVIGSAHDDQLSGNALDNTLRGGAGDDLLDGGAGDDWLNGDAGRNILLGGEGDDALVGGGQDDTLRGGAGDDWILAGGGANLIDGGAGNDTLFLGDAKYRVDAVLGTITSPSGQISHFSGIERLVTRIGSDIPAMPGTMLVGHTATELAIATIAFAQPRRHFTVERESGAQLALRVHDASGQNALAVERLDGVERLIFSDQVLAFGERALQVAKVAFALWSKDIAPSTTLFGKGIDWYDQGHSYTELIDFALGYHAGLSDAQFAQTLLNNVPGSRSANDVLALMASHGGGQAGRAYVTQLFADDPANLTNIELAGFKTQGIACSLFFDAEALFAIPGG